MDAIKQLITWVIRRDDEQRILYMHCIIQRTDIHVVGRWKFKEKRITVLRRKIIKQKLFYTDSRNKTRSLPQW